MVQDISSNINCKLGIIILLLIGRYLLYIEKVLRYSRLVSFHLNTSLVSTQLFVFSFHKCNGAFSNFYFSIVPGNGFSPKIFPPNKITKTCICFFCSLTRTFAPTPFAYLFFLFRGWKIMREASISGDRGPDSRHNPQTPGSAPVPSRLMPPWIKVLESIHCKNTFCNIPNRSFQTFSWV